MSINNDKILITQEGLEELKEEHQELFKVKRPEIVARLASARNEGDLSENSNYTQSKDELSFIDGRISELEDVISRSRVISKEKSYDEIKLGCQVTVKNGQGVQVFHLVGEWEADPNSMKISYKSPLGQSLLGKKVGEEFEFEAPAGKIVYQITKIE